MAKSSRQKLKILYIARALSEQTDEEHPMTAAALIRYLGDFGIQAERKAVYDDLEVLRTWGMDIRSRRKRPSGFYLASRIFDPGELRLLADAVQSAEFISQEKSRALMKKLEKLAGTCGASALRQELYVEKRPGVMDEGIYRNVDLIRKAMAQDKQVSFIYLEWTVGKKLVPKKNGERYQVSPWGVIWKDGNFYMVGIDEKYHVVKHYRVDKMQAAVCSRQQRTGAEMFEHFDSSEFASRTFGMFGGREETVTLEMENHLVGVLIDRFGENVRIFASDDRHFRALLRVQVSRQFFGWLAGLGPGVEIILSKRTRFEYQRFLRRAMEAYHGSEEERKTDDRKVRPSGTAGIA